jgi:hypothetical protein
MSKDLQELLEAAEDAVARAQNRDQHLAAMMVLERVRYHIASHPDAA